MPKHLHLEIPTPCHENWDQMTPSEKGRFCGSCQKQVVDFTNMSEAQIVAVFRKKSSGSVCGRFMNDQLDKAMLIPKKRIPWVKYFFKFALPLFFATKVHSQGKVIVKKTMGEPAIVVTDKPVAGKDIKVDKSVVVEASKALSKIRIVTGKVTSENGEPVSYASIMIDDNSNQGTMADSSGVFSLYLPLDHGKTLEISAVGYKTKKVEITPDQVNSNLVLDIKIASNVELPPVIISSSTTIMGAMRVVTGLVMRVRTIKESVIEEKKVMTVPAMIVYPNPIVSGSSVNIKCDKIDEGYYSFRVISMSGQTVSDKEIWIDKEARILNMPVPSVAAGNYILSFTNRKTGKKFSEKVMIQ